MENLKPQKTLAVKEMAAQHRNSMHKLSPRTQYLYMMGGKHLSHWKYQPLQQMTALGVILGIAMCYLLWLCIATNWSPFQVAYLICSMIIFACYAVIQRKRKRSYLEAYRICREYAEYHEPELIWHVDYPQKGEKGELVTAILTSRKFLRMVENATTLPIGSKVREAYYAHLVRSITDSPEDDISHYLYNEVNHLCDSAKLYMTEYAPLVGLDLEMRVAPTKETDK